VSTAENQVAGDGMMRAPARAMIIPLVILVMAVAVLMGGIYGWHVFVAKKFIEPMMKGMASAPQTVSTTIAAASSWQPRSQALGTLRAVRGADLAAQASGVVDKIHIESGTEIAAGTVLLALKPNDDPAKLAQLQAQAELASITLKRDQEQLEAQAVSQATVDTDVSNLKAARAQVAAQQALIEEKVVRAPFAGRLGIRLVDEGQYLAAGTTVVTLQALDPIFIDFYPDAPFSGNIVSVNSKVDAASRNVQVRASFANADRRLVPGMYATVAIDDGDPSTLVTLPQSAITHNPYGDTVYLVVKSGTDDKGNAKLTVVQRFVKLGDTRGDQIAVKSGIVVGDEVVTAGQMKLRNGSAVVINNKIIPSNDSNPTPPNE
jgi:membrane fusion protein, multidrug efflux system